MSDRQWVGFLRGMNLGSRRLTNDELVAAVEACGCRGVVAYQASGNVVFADDRNRAGVEAALESGLAEELGYGVAVHLRSSDDVRAIAQAAPFSDEQLADRGKPQVILLASDPSDEVRAEIDELVPSGDVLVHDGTELHWLPAGGVGRSLMDFRRLDKLTGGTTVRTHGTVTRLADKFL